MQEDYVTYVTKVLESPIASLVKFLDMNDNLQIADYQI